MDDVLYLWLPFIVGAVLLGTVIWRFVKGDMQDMSSIAIALAIFGFCLVVSPAFSSIAIKGAGWEIALLREAYETTSQQYAAVIESSSKILPTAEARALRSEQERIQSIQTKLFGEGQVRALDRESARALIRQLSSAQERAAAIISGQ